MGPIKTYLNENETASIEQLPIRPKKLAELIALVEAGTLNFSVASGRIFSALLQQPEADCLQLATQLNLIQESDTGAIETWVDEALAAMPDKVKEYRSGKKGLIGLFAGEVKKRSKGKADMQLVNKLLAEKLQG